MIVNLCLETKLKETLLTKESNIQIPNLLLSDSPPTKTDEAFEKELDRSKNEFNRFNQDLDEIAHSMEKLFEGAPEWLANIEKIKREQGSKRSFIYLFIYLFLIII
jgi:hypothetical protein